MVIVERPVHTTLQLMLSKVLQMFLLEYITVLSNVMVIVERPESYHQQTIL